MMMISVIDVLGVADIIFFIYLYQRWIYPVDMRRHADSDDEDDVREAAEHAEQAAPLADGHAAPTDAAENAAEQPPVTEEEKKNQ
jgi:hypothetical protein